MSMRSVFPTGRPVRFRPERRRGLRNGRHDPIERRRDTDPRRGPAETVADTVAQTVYMARSHITFKKYIVFTTTVAVAVGVWNHFG